MRLCVVHVFSAHERLGNRKIINERLTGIRHWTNYLRCAILPSFLFYAHTQRNMYFCFITREGSAVMLV